MNKLVAFGFRASGDMPCRSENGETFQEKAGSEPQNVLG